MKRPAPFIDGVATKLEDKSNLMTVKNNIPIFN